MGSMEVEHTSNPTTVEGWQMALLLLAFATVTFILEKTLHILEHLVKSKRGLAIALEHIKNELLCVGSISLLLSAFQNLLAQICIPLSGPSVYTDRRRRLLGGGGETYCQPNGQSLWPVSLQHDTHIFIFVVACTHIVYGTFTVYLTIWRVKTWRKWEEEAQAQARANGGDMKVMKMPAKFLYRNVGSNPVIHFFLMLFRQYGTSANQTLYYNARLLFIEKNLQADLSYEFNFHDVVIKGLETELMRTLHPEWHLWLIAVVWYAIPPPSYVSYWMYGISFIIIVLVGAKLVNILVQISVQVAVKYGDSVVYGRMANNPRETRELQVLGRSSLRAPLTNSPAIQRRFLDGLTDLLPSGWGGQDAGVAATTCTDGVGTGAAAAAAAAGPTANGTAGAAPISGWASYLPQLPSRELVLQMLKSMASELSGGGGSFGGGSGAAGVKPATSTRLGSGRPVEEAAAASQPPGVPSAALRPEPGAGRDPGLDRRPSGHELAAEAATAATAADAAAAAEPPVTSVTLEEATEEEHEPEQVLVPAPAPATARVGDAPVAVAVAAQPGGEGLPRRMSLARGSAPATVRRPLTAHQLLLLHNSGRGTGTGSGGGAGGGNSSGGGAPPPSAAAAALKPAASFRGGGGGGPTGLRSHLSVIAEHRPSFRIHKGHQKQPTGKPNHNHHHNHHHRHSNHHATDQHGARGRLSLEAQDASPPPRAATTSANDSQEPQQSGGGGVAGDGGGGVAPQAARGGSAPWNSVFEVFQRHPDHRPRTLSLRRAFHALGIGADNDAAAPPAPKHPPPPPSLQPTQNHNQRSPDPVPRPSPADGGSGSGGGGGPPGGGSGAAAADGSATEEAARASGGVGSQGGAVVVVMEGTPAEIAPAPTAATAVTTTTAFTTDTGKFSEAEEEEEGETEEEEGEASSCSTSDSGGGAFRPKRTRSGRRKVVPLFLRPCYCGAKYLEPSSQYVKNLIKQRGDRGVGDLDAKHYFWFKRPRFMTSLFTVAYFQNSLSIAVCIFTLAGLQDSINTWQGTTNWGILLQLLLDLLLVPQVALSVLPLYALIQPLGSHCPKNLMEYAMEAEEERRQKKKRQEAHPRKSRLSELSTHWQRDKNTKKPDQGGERGVLARFSNMLRWRGGSRKPEALAEVAPATSMSPKQQRPAGPPVGKAHSYMPQRGSRAVTRQGSRAGRATSEVLPGMGSQRPALPMTLSLGRRNSQPPGLRLNGMGSAGASPASPSSKAALSGPPQLTAQAHEHQHQRELPPVQVVVVQPGQHGDNANGGNIAKLS